MVELGQKGVVRGGEGGDCQNTLKGGGTEKRGNKDFKKGGKPGQGVGALKRGA